MAFPPTDWGDFTTDEYQVGAPGTSYSFERWFRNPVAMAQGAVGAPRIEYDAMGDWFKVPSNAMRDWVVSRYLLAGLGGVGSFAMLSEGSTTARAAGFTTSGANLAYTNGANDTPLGSPSGTWMLMGRLNGAIGTPGMASVWQRIS